MTKSRVSVTRYPRCWDLGIASWCHPSFGAEQALHGAVPESRNRLGFQLDIIAHLVCPMHFAASRRCQRLPDASLTDSRLISEAGLSQEIDNFLLNA